MRNVIISAASVLVLSFFVSRADAQAVAFPPGGLQAVSPQFQNPPGTIQVAPKLLPRDRLGAPSVVPGIFGQNKPGGKSGQQSGGKPSAPAKAKKSKGKSSDWWKPLADPGLWLGHMRGGQRMRSPRRSTSQSWSSSRWSQPAPPANSPWGLRQPPTVPHWRETRVVELVNETRYEIPFRFRGRTFYLVPGDSMPLELTDPEELGYPEGPSGYLVYRMIDRGVFRFVEIGGGDIRLVRAR